MPDRGPPDDGPQTTEFQGGRLVLRDGCIFFEDRLVVWPRDTRLDLSRPGRIALIHRESAATVGEYISVSGPPLTGRIEGLPPGACGASELHVLNGFEPISPAEWEAMRERWRRMPPQPPPARVPPSPTSRPLEIGDLRGTWRVTRIAGQAPVSREAAVTFGAKELTASAGCNRYDALLTVQGSRLVATAPDFRPMSTDAACASPEGAQEGPLFAALRPGSTLTLLGDDLVIRAPDGLEVRLLRFSPASANP